MKTIEDRELTAATLNRIVCSPGGREIEGQDLKGEIGRTIAWREGMLTLGMQGFVSYENGVVRGFIEYMPSGTAPFPIIAPGAAVLMCYHWIPEGKNEEEHAVQEKRLIRLMIERVEGRCSGIATLGWDNPVHFPIQWLEELGFQQLESDGHIALMWLPLREAIPGPTMAAPRFRPRDLSAEGLLAIDSASSSRCPYSIHNAARLERIIEESPGTDRIRHFAHRIDTHEDAVRWSISPWDWAWLFLNGEKIALHELKSEELQQLIAGKISQLT